MIAVIFASLVAPTIFLPGTNSPFLKKRIVGTERIANSSVVSGDSSISTLPTAARPS